MIFNEHFSTDPLVQRVTSICRVVFEYLTLVSVSVPCTLRVMTTLNYYLCLVKHYLSVKVSSDVVNEKYEISRTDEALLIVPV